MLTLQDIPNNYRQRDILIYMLGRNEVTFAEILVFFYGNRANTEFIAFRMECDGYIEKGNDGVYKFGPKFSNIQEIKNQLNLFEQ